MEPEISRWVLEFLVWQPLEDRTLNNLIAILPLAGDNHRITKSLLLRKLDSEAAAGIPSEKMLSLLELIEELDSRSGGHHSAASLKTAYCHVAVACTMRLLHDDDDDEYFRAVKRIWRDRVPKAKSGLVSDDLRIWTEEIENGRIEEDSAVIDGVAAVRRYVEEEKEKMGPSFLETLAEASSTDDSFRELLRLHSANKVTQQGTKRKYEVAEADAAQKGLNLSSSELKSDAMNFASNEMHVEQKHGGNGTPVEGNGVDRANDCSNRQRDAPGPSLMEKNSTMKWKDAPGPSKDSAEMPVQQKYAARKLTTKGAKMAEVDVVQKALNPSSSELKYDAAINLASKHSTKMAVEQKHDGNGMPVEGSRPAPCNGVNTANDCSNRQRDAPGPSLIEQNSTMEWEASKDSTEMPVQQNYAASKLTTKGAGPSNVTPPAPCNGVDTANRQSLMARNSTAQTMEREDDPSNGKRARLSSPAAQPVSPLNIRADKSKDSIKPRRATRKWSLTEADTLRAGVAKFGKSNWKSILRAYRDKFEGRTEVDLKDKWRIMKGRN